MASRARGSAIARADGRIAAHFADTEAQVALARSDAPKALELADEAIGLAEANEVPTALLDALVTRARALLALGRASDGIETFERAASIARKSAPQSRVRQVLSAWADALADAGRPDEAYAIAREALASR
jgi:tetratricopeptide (TPR) repeat protein